MEKSEYLKVSNKTMVRILDNQIKVEPPLADYPVEITVYTLNGSTLTVKRMFVPKSVISDIKEMAKLNDKIDRMSEGFKINEQQNAYGYVGFYNENTNAMFIKELDEYREKYKKHLSSFEKLCEGNDKELPLEQYEIKDLDPMNFVLTLEKLKEQFGLCDLIPDSKTSKNFVKTVNNICNENEAFNDAVANLKKTTFLKGIGMGLLLIILNIIVSEAIDLTTLINSANLSPIYNILISLGPVAVLSGIGFVSYVQYEEQHGKLITNHSINKNIISKDFESKISTKGEPVDIKSVLDSTKNPEQKYQTPENPVMRCTRREEKRFLEALRRDLLNNKFASEGTQQSDTKPKQKKHKKPRC